VIAALILHRKSDGVRVLVGAVGLHIPEDAEEWPYVETFDEIANALNAQHVLDDDVAQIRTRMRAPYDPQWPGVGERACKKPIAPFSPGGTVWPCDLREGHTGNCGVLPF
jgi:hypothetical protein